MAEVVARPAGCPDMYSAIREHGKKMARKTKEEAEKTRQHILDAALNVFCKKGFVRATLKDIADDAGVTRGAIYWHFKDKVDLLEVLSRDIDASAGARVEDILNISVDSLGDIRKKIMAWLNHFNTNERYRRFYEFIYYKIEYHQDLGPVLAKRRTEDRLILNHFEETLQKLQAAGLVRKDIQARHAAIMVLSFLTGLIEMWLTDNTLFPLSRDAPVMVDHFLDNLLKA